MGDQRLTFSERAVVIDALKDIKTGVWRLLQVYEAKKVSTLDGVPEDILPMSLDDWWGRLQHVIEELQKE